MKGNSIKEFFVIYDGANTGDSYCGTLFLEDLDLIFSWYNCRAMPHSIRESLEALLPGQTFAYTFPGTTDTIRICNASDLLEYTD